MSYLAKWRRHVGALIALAALACVRNPRSDTGPLPSPEYAAVRYCATTVAVGEGFLVSDAPGTAQIAVSSLPRDSVSWVEWVVLRVRITPDSALPEANTRRVQYNSRRSVPVSSTGPLSSTGRRIQDRVNQECRIARAVDSQF